MFYYFKLTLSIQINFVSSYLQEPAKQRFRIHTNKPRSVRNDHPEDKKQGCLAQMHRQPANLMKINYLTKLISALITRVRRKFLAGGYSPRACSYSQPVTTFVFRMTRVPFYPMESHTMRRQKWY